MTTTLVIAVVVAIVVIVFPSVITGLALLFCKDYTRNKSIPFPFRVYLDAPHLRKREEFALANYANFWRYIIRSKYAKKFFRLSYLLSGFFIWGYVLVLINLGVRKLVAAI